MKDFPLIEKLGGRGKEEGPRGDFFFFVTSKV
jgi:hypothetical protein